MAEPTRKPCSWCAKGYARLLLDADGTLSSISGRPGIWGHAADDYYWPCEQDYPVHPKRERRRDPFELLRDQERAATGSQPSRTEAP
jgi:hypothetical protein